MFLDVVDTSDPEGYADALDWACGEDSELRMRVEALLKAHERADELLDRPFVGPSDLRRGLSGSQVDRGAESEGHVTTFELAASGPVDSSESALAFDVDSIFNWLDRQDAAGRLATAVDGYEIQGELGRGGMGVVYKARQVKLDRPCVLKMILGGIHARPEAVARFLVEAQSIARLQHRNIVQIYQIGEWDGLPYLELEYVEGGGLDRLLDGTPCAVSWSAGMVEPLARAVAEAHRRRVIHRDIKPANILIGADGTPKLSDFGLAKALGVDSGLTATEAIMGSPSYMAPEQAEGRTHLIGPLADVYALGAVLYELLTGRPPFRGATLLETLEQTKTVEPIPPSRLVPRIPRDVETIALKCLQKDPSRRYATAEELADDLSRFQSGKPIVARPVSAGERAWRWCRRHPAPAGLTAAVVLVAALGLIGILWQWREAVQARDLAASRAMAEAEARRETEAMLVELHTASGVAAGDRGEYAEAALWFANAARLAEADPHRRQTNGIRARTWDNWAISPLRAVVIDDSWPGGLRLHPSGRYLIATTVVDGHTRDAEHSLWDLDRERSLRFPDESTSVTAAAWSPDGSSIAIGGPEGGVALCPFPGGGKPTRIAFPGRIRLLEFSDDGRFLAIAGGALARVWDVRAGTFATHGLEHPGAVSTLAIHSEGRSLATGCLDGQARLFAVTEEGDEPLWPPVPHVQRGPSGPWDHPFFSAPTFVDGGRGLITYDGQGGLSWRNVETGEVVRTLDSPDISGRFAAIEPSPDGRWLAAISFQNPAIVRTFDLASGLAEGAAIEHENTITGAAFSPDSRQLLTGSTDSTARRWSVPDGKPVGGPLDLHRDVQAVSYGPGGRSLITQDGGLVRLWGLPDETLHTSPLPIDAPASFAAISPDGTLAMPNGMTFLTGRGLRTTRAYRVSTGQPAGPWITPGGIVLGAAFSPDGRSVGVLGADDVWGEERHHVTSWDWGGGRRRWRAGLPSEPRSVSYRPDGLRLAVLCGGGEVVVFDPASGVELRRWQAHDAEPAHHWINNGDVGFTPDGRTLLTWGMGDDLRGWDAESGEPRFAPIRHGAKCHDVRFSPDGSLMAVASYDGSVRVRHPGSGAVVAELPVHPDIVYSAAFSPDGRLLATACRDRSIRVWDWSAGRLACPPFESEGEAVDACFTPDGLRVISVDDDGSVRAWDWNSGKPITPPLPIGENPLTIAVAPDGARAIVGGFRDTLFVLDLSELDSTRPVDPDALCLQAELLAGQRILEGGTDKLSAEEWLELWRSTPRHDRPGLPSSASVPEAAPARLAESPRPAVESAEEPAVDAVAVLERVEELLWAHRADEAAEAAGPAIARLRLEIGADPGNQSLRHSLALALVVNGDRDAYRRACASTIEDCVQPDPLSLVEAARSCLVGPDPGIDPAGPRFVIESALDQDPKAPWLHYMLGLASYRDGLFEDAVKHLERSLEIGEGWPGSSLNEVVLAMAFHRLGLVEEARRRLDSVSGRGPTSDKAETTVDPIVSASWWDRIEFLLLRREADALIRGDSPPAP